MKRLLPILVLVGAIVCVVAVFAISPIGKPPDHVETVSLLPGFGVKRMYMLSASNRRSLPHRPRTVTLTTKGSTFRAYVLDLDVAPDARERVELFLAASRAIELGKEPPDTGVVDSAVGVSYAKFRLHYWPWGSVSRYMLVLASDVASDIEVRTSYGGSS